LGSLRSSEGNIEDGVRRCTQCVRAALKLVSAIMARQNHGPPESWPARIQLLPRAGQRSSFHVASCSVNAPQPPSVPSWLTRHPLDAAHSLYSTQLPAACSPSSQALQAIWNLHPADFPEITIHGRLVKIPRWQQAYGRDYRFSGRVNRALPVPTILEPLLAWTREQLDPRLNGLVLNWYDAAREHYIGPHRDKTKGLLEGAPIVTISLGEERVFRVRPWRGSGVMDFAAAQGAVFVMPFETNQAFTHEVPHFARYQGRRISVTVRAFDDASG
jgi:alkylated DNA repair dioxygenase AlkB